MSDTRVQSTILFADIVGYTAMMQEDEVSGLDTLTRFRAALEQHVPACGGKIIQYFGDGCLLAFPEASHAIDCAQQLQARYIDELDIPVRMGVHTGEVVFRDNNAFGDTVNLASRVESLGVPGSVLLSQAVRKSLTELSDVNLTSLGAFDFKNVKQAIEIFAVEESPLTIPRRDQMLGKLKEKKPVNRWLRTGRRILLYAVVTWGLVQALGFGLYKMDISPHWATLFHVIAWGILPSLAIYAFHQERIQRGVLRWREKIIFPLNLLILAFGAYFSFGNTDFGATTTEISFAGIGGNLETRTILKEQYRTSIPVFSFSPQQTDSVDFWIGDAIKVYMLLDLRQDKSVLPTDAGEYDYTTVDKIASTRLFQDLYVDGSYTFQNGVYTISPEIHKSRNGQQIASRTFQGENLLTLVDSISVYVREAMGVSKARQAMSIDLPLEEFTSKNNEAIKLYSMGVNDNTRIFLENALEVDSTMVLSWLQLGKYNLGWNKGRVEAQNAFDQAYQFRSKLPSDMQLEVMIYRHLAYQAYAEAEKLVRLQLAIEPNNEEFNNILFKLLGATLQLEPLLEHAEALFAREQSEQNGHLYANALHLNGEDEKFMRLLKPFLAIDPQNEVLLTLELEGSLFDEDWERALKAKEKIDLLYPKRKPRTAIVSEIVANQMDENTPTPDLASFEGVFRTNFDEGYLQTWAVDDRLIQYYANQYPGRKIWVSDNKIAEIGLYKTWITNFRKGRSGEFEWALMEQISWQKVDSVILWKRDSLIQRAESLLFEQDYRRAEAVYQKAIHAHPEHVYLQKALDHIHYIQETPVEILEKQYSEIIGAYENRRLWMEKGRLFVKREGRARIEILPVSAYQYISLSSVGITINMHHDGEAITGYTIEAYNPDEAVWWDIGASVAKVPLLSNER